MTDREIPNSPRIACHDGKGGLVRPGPFYDAAGSKLFDAITRLPEYYPTRTEVAILRANQRGIARHAGGNACLVEYGSGSSTKVRTLLALDPAAYVPVDISKDHLEATARAVYDDYPALAVYPTCADYTTALELPPPVASLSRLAFFPGSSIGNFDPDGADAFLRAVAHTVGAGGCLLVGVDAKKDPDVLGGAYNDASGVTARFNRNLLSHVNAAVGANFDPRAFDHRAVYNEAAGRIEMYLDSRSDQVVRVNGEEVAFAAGEPLRTANSYKYPRRSSKLRPSAPASNASPYGRTTAATTWCICCGWPELLSILRCRDVMNVHAQTRSHEGSHQIATCSVSPAPCCIVVPSAAL